MLFIDEIHRFNKAQQDALLPFIESGLFILIGATTENPSFELNNALLSRTRVYVLKKLSLEETIQVIDRALTNDIDGLGKKTLNSSVKKQLATIADGDARQVLNLLEIAAALAENNIIDMRILQTITQTTCVVLIKVVRFFMIKFQLYISWSWIRSRRCIILASTHA